MKPTQFNPDELKLSKQDIFEMLDSISARFKKNKKGNMKFIISVEAMKIGIRMMDDQTLTQIWTEIINGFNELLYQNALNGGNTWSENLRIVKDNLKNFE
jgi:hypothetical protein